MSFIVGAKCVNNREACLCANGSITASDFSQVSYSLSQPNALLRLVWDSSTGARQQSLTIQQQPTVLAITFCNFMNF